MENHLQFKEKPQKFCPSNVLYYMATLITNTFFAVNMADDFDFHDDDAIKSMRRKRLSTSISITPSEYLYRNRQAVVSSRKDEVEDTTTL